MCMCVHGALVLVKICYSLVYVIDTYFGTPMDLNNATIPVQDAPTVLDEEDVHLVANFIQGRLTTHFQTENDRNRKVPMSQIADKRVDVCLFLLGPNHVSTVDVAALRAIGGCAPIVPLLAKVLLPRLLEWTNRPIDLVSFFSCHWHLTFTSTMGVLRACVCECSCARAAFEGVCMHMCLLLAHRFSRRPVCLDTKYTPTAAQPSMSLCPFACRGL